MSNNEERESGLEAMARHRRASKEDGRKRFQDESRERLKRVIQAKIKTTMIGAIANVEQHLGHHWGHGKPPHAKTDQEIGNEEVYHMLRTDILNQGNNQLRAAIAEIDQYDISWRRYHYDMAHREDPSELTDQERSVYGINEDGTHKKLRYGTNPDGSIKVRPNEEGIDE